MTFDTFGKAMPVKVVNPASLAPAKREML